MGSLNLGDLQVGVKVDSGKATKDLKYLQGVLVQTEGTTDKLEKEFKDLNVAINKIDFGKLEKNMTTFGNTMTTKVTLPLAAVGAASFKMAADMEQAVGKTDAVFNDNSQVIKNWSEDAINSMGMAQVTALQMSSGFGALGTALKVSEEQALEMSMSLTQLSSDLAAFYDTSLSEANTGLTAIFTGEMEAMKKFGTIMSVANLEAYALSQGIKKTYESMSEAEKVLLRYNFVMESTAVAQGTFAREQDSASVQLQIFKESMKELGVTIGEELLPVITPLIEDLNDLIQAFGNLDSGTQGTIVNMGLLAMAIGPVTKALLGLKTAYVAIQGASAVVTGAVGISSAALLGLGAAAVYTTGTIYGLVAAEKEGNRQLEESTELIEKDTVTTWENIAARDAQLQQMLLMQDEYVALTSELETLNARSIELQVLMANEEVGTVKWQAYSSELQNVSDRLNAINPILSTNEKAIADQYWTVDDGLKILDNYRAKIDLNTKAVNEETIAEEKRAKAIQEGAELSEKGIKYIKDSADSYTELAMKQELSAAQIAEMAELESILIETFGQEIIIRDELGRGIGVNISLINDEAIANNLLDESKRKAVNNMAEYGKNHVYNLRLETLQTISELERQIKAYDSAAITTAQRSVLHPQIEGAKAELAKLKKDVEGYDLFKYSTSSGGSNSSYEKDKDNFTKNEEEKQKTFEELQEERIAAYENEIETKRYYNNLTLNEELAMYQELITIAEGNASQQERITREIFRVKQDMLQQEVDAVTAACDEEIRKRQEVLDQEVKAIDYGLSEELKELQGQLDRLDYEAEQSRIALQKQEKQQAIEDAKKRLGMAVTEEERYAAAQDLKKKELDYEKFNSDLKLKEERRRIQEQMKLAREEAARIKEEKKAAAADDIKDLELQRDAKLEITEMQYEKEFEMMTGKKTDFNIVETDISKDLLNQLNYRNEIFRKSVDKDISYLDNIRKAISSAFIMPDISSAIGKSVSTVPHQNVPSVSQVNEAYRNGGSVVNDNSNVTINNYVRDDKDMDSIARVVKKTLSRDIGTFRRNKGGSRK